ncbi:sodium- and chloride-dependent neutral and basic amino acid transporter B(0+)-like [Hemiscyllium ocellatum]|uniref:sodium- and chloride-dependent neutral and basic amino acid transporter B(0+)-like n=1 Tax=Hemiscyllium ocellatum TaxID=170820 RepID=UPI00296650AF|nr:sodium- and chloride-dependent neutral and basic amino acid transporter B(0+)-like [Hemiscyllium ocellatum]
MGNNAGQTLYCRVNNHMGQEEQTLNHSWQAIHNWLQTFGPSKTDWSKKPACQQNGSEDVKNFAERFVDVWIKLPGLAPNNNPEKEDEIWSECQQLEEIPLKVFTTSFPASGSTLRKYTKNRWVPSGKSAANPAVNRNDENVKRGNWSSKTDYLLSMIGCAVGLGNVWRFPFLAYKNGGGVFLIPYSIMLGLVGIPIFFLESSFGQFASLGPVAVWKSVPMLQGVGVTMVLLIVIANISYACIIGYSLYYLFASFQSPLPWADCFSWWGADETCSRTPKDPFCNLTLDDGYFEVINTTWLQTYNNTCLIGSEISIPHQGPSEQYWDQAVLHRTSSLDETGEIVWHLALCLLLAWLMVGAAFLKGIKSSGKVVYFTAIIPYVVLTILLIRGVTLEGASKGIEFYIGSQSDFSKLADAQVWKDAATQIFYSTSVGWGSLITLSSYNKFHNNCYQDTIIVCVVNCATSVFAGFIIFSTLGHMTHVQNKPVSEVAQSGFGLAFIAYPEALAQLPWATLWSILFFFMLITLGLDTLFASFETVITSLLDQFPEFLRPKRLYLTAGLCLLFYFLGLLFVTQAGIYWLHLMDYFCTGWILIVVALLELIGLSWIYGINRFIKDIEMMIGKRNWLFWLWWRACWILISPCILTAILVWSLTTFALPTYGPVEYSVWSIALGWCMIILCIMWVPIIAVVRVVQAEVFQDDAECGDTLHFAQENTLFVVFLYAIITLPNPLVFVIQPKDHAPSKASNDPARWLS